MDADVCAAQDEKEHSGSTTASVEPAGRDLYIPYVPMPSLTPDQRTRQRDNVEQIKLLAEMNKLTVELVKRRSNRQTAAADTPALIRRIKALAKQLHDE